MATIPMGNFGQAVAGNGPVPNLPQGNPIGQAAERLGATAQGIVNEAAQQETQQAQARQRAQAALALAKATNGLHDAHDAVAQGVLDGSIPVDKAAGEFEKQAGKVREATFSGWQPEQRDAMDAHLTTQYGALGRSLGGVVIKRQQQDTATAIDEFGEQVSREAARSGPGWASEKFAAMVDHSGQAAGLSSVQQQKLKQSFTERATATFFTSAATGALTRGDPDALRAVREQIAGPQGDALDPAKRAELTHRVFGWEESVRAQQDRAGNKAADQARVQYNRAVDVFNKGTDIALGGGYFSPDFITELTTSAAGTEMAGPVNDLIASQRTVAGFASRSASEREAIIERMRAERATPGVGTNPMGDRLLAATETMQTKLLAATADNPWAATQRAGLIQNAPLIDASDPQSAVEIVRNRMAQIGAVERWAGTRVSPLQPQEVEQVGKMVRALPVDQAATLLASFGTAVGNGERVAALGKQLHDKDGALGLAMMYASAQTTDGRLTAELVLRGDQALKDKTARADPAVETGWKATIAKSIRGAYSNREAEDATVQAAYLIAAANFAKDGSSDVSRAVNLATGGIAERNGQKFPLPYGVKEPEFDKQLAAAAPPQVGMQAADGLVRVGATTLPVADFLAQLPQASLVHAGQGQYNVRAGSGLVTNSAGKRITIKVGP